MGSPYDPLGNCHLTVKKLPKNCHKKIYKYKKFHQQCDTRYIYFQIVHNGYIAIGNFLKKMKIFGNFFEKNENFWQLKKVRLLAIF